MTMAMWVGRVERSGKGQRQAGGGSWRGRRSLADHVRQRTAFLAGAQHARPAPSRQPKPTCAHSASAGTASQVSSQTRARRSLSAAVPTGACGGGGRASSAGGRAGKRLRQADDGPRGRLPRCGCAPPGSTCAPHPVCPRTPSPTCGCLHTALTSALPTSASSSAGGPTPPCHARQQTHLQLPADGAGVGLAHQRLLLQRVQRVQLARLDGAQQRGGQVGVLVNHALALCAAARGGAGTGRCADTSGMPAGGTGALGAARTRTLRRA